MDMISWTQPLRVALKHLIDVSHSVRRTISPALVRPRCAGRTGLLVTENAKVQSTVKRRYWVWVKTCQGPNHLKSRCFASQCEVSTVVVWFILRDHSGSPGFDPLPYYGAIPLPDVQLL